MIKKHWKRAEKAKNTPLGCGSRAFESRHSDQNPLKSVDFRGFSYVFLAQILGKIAQFDIFL